MHCKKLFSELEHIYKVGKNQTFYIKSSSLIHRYLPFICHLSGFCCVSCVPASCVHIWFVSCPCFMSLWVKYVPAVFVSLCVNYPVYLVPVFWVWFRLVYSLFPGVSVHVSPALSSTLKTIIWVYVLVCVSLFLPRVCTVTSLQYVWNLLAISDWNIFSTSIFYVLGTVKIFYKDYWSIHFTRK